MKQSNPSTPQHSRRVSSLYRHWQALQQVLPCSGLSHLWCNPLPNVLYQSQRLWLSFDQFFLWNLSIRQSKLLKTSLAMAPFEFSKKKKDNNYWFSWYVYRWIFFRPSCQPSVLPCSNRETWCCWGFHNMTAWAPKIKNQGAIIYLAMAILIFIFQIQSWYLCMYLTFYDLEFFLAPLFMLVWLTVKTTHCMIFRKKPLYVTIFTW